MPGGGRGSLALYVHTGGIAGRSDLIFLLPARALSKLGGLPLLQPPAADYKGEDRPTIQVSGPAMWRGLSDSFMTWTCCSQSLAPLYHRPRTYYLFIYRRYGCVILQVNCRRRCVIWAELVRSAAAGKMEDIVRTAAPYCLSPTWVPEVDREMVLLQAQVAYLEAEACAAALQAQRREVVPPLVDAADAADERGLRLPSAEVHLLQGLFLKVRGSRGRV